MSRLRWVSRKLILLFFLNPQLTYASLLTANCTHRLFLRVIWNTITRHKVEINKIVKQSHSNNENDVLKRQNRVVHISKQK